MKTLKYLLLISFIKVKKLILKNNEVIKSNYNYNNINIKYVNQYKHEYYYTNIKTDKYIKLISILISIYTFFIININIIYTIPICIFWKKNKTNNILYDNNLLLTNKKLENKILYNEIIPNKFNKSYYNNNIKIRFLPFNNIKKITNTKKEQVINSKISKPINECQQIICKLDKIFQQNLENNKNTPVSYKKIKQNLDDIFILINELTKLNKEMQIESNKEVKDVDSLSFQASINECNIEETYEFIDEFTNVINQTIKKNEEIIEVCNRLELKTKKLKI